MHKWAYFVLSNVVACFIRIVSTASDGNKFFLLINDAHDIALLEISLNLCHSYKQQAHGLLATQSFGSLGIDVDDTFGEALAVCNPLFHGRRGIGVGPELSVHGLLRMLGQVDEDVVGLSVGDDNLDAFVCHFALF